MTSDAANPALPADSFDVVLGRHVLWAMPDIDAALSQWTRLLKSCGVLVLVEGRWHTPELVSQPPRPNRPSAGIAPR